MTKFRVGSSLTLMWPIWDRVGNEKTLIPSTRLVNANFSPAGLTERDPLWKKTSVTVWMPERVLNKEYGHPPVYLNRLQNLPGIHLEECPIKPITQATTFKVKCAYKMLRCPDGDESTNETIRKSEETKFTE